VRLAQTGLLGSASGDLAHLATRSGGLIWRRFHSPASGSIALLLGNHELRRTGPLSELDREQLRVHAGSVRGDGSHLNERLRRRLGLALSV